MCPKFCGCGLIPRGNPFVLQALIRGVRLTPNDLILVETPPPPPLHWLPLSLYYPQGHIHAQDMHHQQFVMLVSVSHSQTTYSSPFSYLTSSVGEEGSGTYISYTQFSPTDDVRYKNGGEEAVLLHETRCPPLR